MRIQSAIIVHMENIQQASGGRVPANMGKYPHLVKKFPQGVLHHKISKGILIYETPDGPRQADSFVKKFEKAQGL